jgi:putative two-component system response regulator
MESRANVPTILIVDDEIGPRESLRMILKTDYNVLTVDGGHAALQVLQQTEIDIVTLDLKMPGFSGIDTLKEIRQINPDVMVIIITGFGNLESAIEGIRYGVFDYIPKPFNVPEILMIIDKSAQRRKFNRKIKEFMTQFQPASAGTSLFSPSLCADPASSAAFFPWAEGAIPDYQHCLEFARVLASTLEEKDPYTSGHSERVCSYTDFIAKKLDLPSNDRDDLKIASYLHDIGKIGISNRFINKKETLTTSDWAIIKQHTNKSIELLAPLRLSDGILGCIQHHHEHFDGTGYPDGLRGGEIPLGARVISVCDAYDSMTSDRPYRKSLTDEYARRELVAHSGGQFDPEIVCLFLDILQHTRDVCRVGSPSTSALPC